MDVSHVVQRFRSSLLVLVTFRDSSSNILWCTPYSPVLPVSSAFVIFFVLAASRNRMIRNPHPRNREDVRRLVECHSAITWHFTSNLSSRTGRSRCRHRPSLKLGSIGRRRRLRPSSVLLAEKTFWRWCFF